MIITKKCSISPCADVLEFTYLHVPCFQNRDIETQNVQIAQCADERREMPSTRQYPPNRKFHVVYKTCVQRDNLASESSSIDKSLQCVLTRSDVFTGPPNLQFLLVFDQTLCQNVAKVLNLTGYMLFSVSFRFIIIFEPVRYRNAKQCICLELAQRFYQNDVLT